MQLLTACPPMPSQLPSSSPTLPKPTALTLLFHVMPQGMGHPSGQPRSPALATVPSELLVHAQAGLHTDRKVLGFVWALPCDSWTISALSALLSFKIQNTAPYQLPGRSLIPSQPKPEQWPEQFLWKCSHKINYIFQTESYPVCWCTTIHFLLIPKPFDNVMNW